MHAWPSLPPFAHHANPRWCPIMGLDMKGWLVRIQDLDHEDSLRATDRKGWPLQRGLGRRLADGRRERVQPLRRIPRR